MQHLPRKFNKEADLLSRQDVQAFGSFRRPEPNGSEVGLVAPIDLETLSGIAQNLYNVGLSEGTHATYSAPINRFIDFTYQTGLRALPAEEETLILFVAHLSSHYKNGFSRIRTAIFAVQSFQVDNNCPKFWGRFHRLHRVLKGIERSNGKSNDRRLAVTSDMMHRLVRLFDTNDPSHRVMWAAMTMAFHGSFRASEFCTTSTEFDTEIHLRRADLTFSPSVYGEIATFYLRQSKNHQYAPIARRNG